MDWKMPLALAACFLMLAVTSTGIFQAFFLFLGMCLLVGSFAARWRSKAHAQSITRESVLSEEMDGGRKCNRCDKPGTRVMTGKDGKELHFCPECYVMMYLAMMIQNRVIEESVLKKAFSAYNKAQGPRDFNQALILFEKIIDRIESLIEEYSLKILASSEPKVARGYMKLITDFLDVYSEMHYLAGKCSFLANRFPVANPTYIVGIEHLLKAIQNRLRFRYGSPELKKELERWAKQSRSAKDVPLLDIPRPSIILHLSGIDPIIQFNDLARKFGSEYAGCSLMLINTYARYKTDLVWFSWCYHLLGQSLVKFGLANRQGCFARSKDEMQRRTVLASRLIPSVFSVGEEAYRLAFWCTEKLPDSEATYSLKVGYGTGLFDLGICLFKQARWKDALECFERALKIYNGEDQSYHAPLNADVGRADSYLYIAKCYFRLGSKEEAGKNVEIALDMAKRLHIRDNVSEAERLKKMVETDTSQVLFDWKVRVKIDQMSPEQVARVETCMKMNRKWRFLGSRESLKLIIEEDLNTLTDLGITPEQVADRLESLTGQAYTKWREKKMRLGEDVLEIARQGCSVEDDFFVSAMQDPSTLEQPCYFELVNRPPFLDEYGMCSDVPSKGAFEYLLLNRTLGQEIRFPEVMIHLIRDHHFFGGKRCPFRLDPSHITRLLGIESGKSYAYKTVKVTIWTEGGYYSSLPKELPQIARQGRKVELGQDVVAYIQDKKGVILTDRHIKFAEPPKIDGIEVELHKNEIQPGQTQIRKINIELIVV